MKMRKLRLWPDAAGDLTALPQDPIPYMDVRGGDGSEGKGKKQRARW